MFPISSHASSIFAPRGIGALLTLAASTALSNAAAGNLKEINPPASPSKEQPMAFVGARLIDGRGGSVVENSVVLIQGDAILSAGSAETALIPREAERFDFTGFSLLPGLIDSHFHSVNDLEVPARFLTNGVTTLRDPGHPFRFYQAVLQTDRLMPRVFLCGAHLDAYPPVWPQQALLVNNADQARAAVNHHVDQGATAIKIYFGLPLDLYEPVCNTATKRGVKVTAHLELVRADDAIRAGVRGIEHVTSFGTSLADPKVASDFIRRVREDPGARTELRYKMWDRLDLGDASKTQPLLDLIVEKDVFVSPTLAVFERREGDREVTDVHVKGFRNMLRFVGMCHDAGAVVVAGSHTYVPHAKFGEAFQRELELLVEAGLSPMEAIQAGTLNNARFFDAEKRLGSIEPGKLADLILVEGKPDENIKDMYNVRHVMLNGHWVSGNP